MGKLKIVETVKGIPSYVKTHWNTPNEGEFLPLKEVTAYTVAQAGTYIFMTASGIMTFSASYFCGAILGIAAMDFYIIGLITQIIGYILMFVNPVGVLIYENHGELSPKMRRFAHICYLGQIIVGCMFYFVPSQGFEFIMKGVPQIIANILVTNGLTGYLNWAIRKKFCAKHGRLKPFLVLYGIPCAILYSIIPYLPVQGLSYTLKLVITHFAFTMLNYFLNNWVGVNGLVTFMTPNSQERQRLHSIVPIITGLFPSIINMFFPILIGITGGYLSLRTYQIFVPIFTFLGAVVALAICQCHERIIEPPAAKRKKVTFFKGAKNVLKNKYFWILNTSNIMGQWIGLVNALLTWWFVYSLRMEWFSGIAANIVVLGMTVGNILTPILTKRFQKRDILISARVVTIATVFGILWAVKTSNIYIFLISMLLKNTISPVVDGISVGLGADILDYHQWKYGERADAMQGIFGWFLTPVNMAIGAVVPWMLKTVGFTSDWDVLFDSHILSEVFSIHTWMSVIGLILITVPFFFYDLTREKHDICVREMQERVKKIEEQDEQLQVEAVEEVEK